MGFPTTIFTSAPPADYICPKCRDVLKDAVSFRECGHIFCQECAEHVLASATCHTCQAWVSGHNPVTPINGTIGRMQVKCSHGDSGTGSATRRTRRRGNNRSAMQDDSCNWTGECSLLQQHGTSCNFKIITCGIEGCIHQCQRKDMENHLSGSGVIIHMNLIKSEMQRKIDAAQRELDASKQKNECLERRIGSMARKISDIQRRVGGNENSEAAQVPTISNPTVIEAGTDEVNGVYVENGTRGGVPKYTRSGMWRGANAEFVLYRDSGVWYISMEATATRRSKDFYCTSLQSGPHIFSTKDPRLRRRGSGRSECPVLMYETL